MEGSLIDYIFLVITGFIAYHGLTYRNAEGAPEFGHMLFGAIAMMFFFRVLLADVLQVW
jgi:hypothetical protein